ncbi:RagB/SusD family nutrient uptake outer membrane protein [Prevotella ihumii]|uniref:RagB/SusD family nutrient uptake outer membrane protein n=1 Tax=Prevotella ihumii TaxID=1917878 RepID=UPI000980EB6C|nr:RagB/SusD family nutrient uptake outer membrane protein [Prevotella ihumii]
MKRIINYIMAGTFVAASALLASCSEDYLNTSPSESVESENAVGTVTNAYNTLNGVAKCMTTQQAPYGQGYSGENAIYRIYESMPSQNYNYNRYAAGWAQVHNQMLHTDNTRKYDSYAWAYYYQVITGANGIIETIDKATGDEKQKKFIKAAALTFRAYSYEKLIRYYCYRWQDSNNGATRGMPLRLDTSNGDLKISTLAETYAQIYKDCEEAVKLFTESGVKRNEAEVWIPTANVAHAVHARAALNKQDYATALAQAKLAEEGYPMVSGADYAAGFYKPSSEWLLGSYGSDKEQNWYWAFGVQDACNGYYANNTDCGAGTIGHELITRIPNNDARKQMFITADKFRNIDITNKDQVNQTYGILGMGDDNVYAQADSIVKAHSLPGLEAPYQAGVFYLDGQMKFWTTAQPGVCYVPFIRTSEMKLIEAEANYFLGNEAAAQQALVDLNAGTGRNESYTCTKTGKDLFNEIKDYREVELWGEGFGWSDYKRWNLPIVRKTFAQGGNAHPAVAVTINPDEVNKWTWVIPQNEKDFNGALTDEKL